MKGGKENMNWKIATFMMFAIFIGEIFTFVYLPKNPPTTLHTSILDNKCQALFHGDINQYAKTDSRGQVFCCKIIDGREGCIPWDFNNGN